MKDCAQRMVGLSEAAGAPMDILEQGKATRAYLRAGHTPLLATGVLRLIKCKDIVQLEVQGEMKNDGDEMGVGDLGSRFFAGLPPPSFQSTGHHNQFERLATSGAIPRPLHITLIFTMHPVFCG
jgi:hypothetical protein